MPSSTYTPNLKNPHVLAAELYTWERCDATYEQRERWKNADEPYNEMLHASPLEDAYQALPPSDQVTFWIVIDNLYCVE
jgi:hypothetical protein